MAVVVEGMGVAGEGVEQPARLWITGQVFQVFTVAIRAAGARRVAYARRVRSLCGVARRFGLPPQTAPCGIGQTEGPQATDKCDMRYGEPKPWNAACVCPMCGRRLIALTYAVPPLENSGGHSRPHLKCPGCSRRYRWRGSDSGSAAVSGSEPPTESFKLLTAGARRVGHSTGVGLARPESDQ